jgi:hypothetical protein
MGLNKWMRRVVVAGGLLASLSAGAQVVLTEPSAPLLPASFGQWKQGGSSIANPSGLTLTTVSKQALEECGPQRSAVADYMRTIDGTTKTIHVEAIQFGDRTGAYSAYTLIRRAGMREGKELGSSDAVGSGAVLFTVSGSVVLVSGASAADLASLKPLAEVMPKVPGNKGVAPVLPMLAPAKGMVNGSLRYALGPATYAAQGGVLPANQLEFGKEGEAVTAEYVGKGGKETLTVLLYPTPAIAGKIAQAINDALPKLGPSFATARVRRDAEAVSLASGTFTVEEAQRLVESVHLRQEFAVDPDVQPVQPSEHVQVVQTYSLLTGIAMLSGVLMLAAVLLGLFLGGGRALYRVARGKPAAVEMEFLSLHLAAENKPAQFGPPASTDGI